jgi:hypothetical protein
MAEDVEAVGLLSNMLIRHTLEDAEAMGMQPIDLLADRLGVGHNALRIAAERAGVLNQLWSYHIDQDEAAAFLAEHSESTEQDAGEHDEREAARLTQVEHEGLDRLLRVTGQETPLVTKAEFQQGAGIDPQLSPRYQSWLTRVETQILRPGLYPQARDEKGFGEVPTNDLMEGSPFAPQCPVGYDGPSQLFIQEDDEQLNPWFWTSAHCLVSWPEQKEIADLETVCEIQGDDALTGLDWELSLAMRKDDGILGYKVITRRMDNAMARAEAEVAKIRECRTLARSGDKRAQETLTRRASEILGKASSWKLWDTTVDGMPVTVEGIDELNDPVFRERPELTLSARMICTVRRKAAKKGYTRTAIAYMDPSVLNEDLRRTIAQTIPGRQRWAIQVWFDPYECGIGRIVPAATAPTTARV